MKKMLLVLFLFSCSSIYGFADTLLTQEITTADNFSIFLPEDWIQIPKDVLTAYQDAVYEMVPNVKKVTYNYGFQLESSQDWMEYPYILVQVDSTGRFSEASVEKIKKSTVESVLKNVGDDLSSLGSFLDVDDVGYDLEHHIFWFAASMNVANVGTITGLTAIILTEKGAIQVMLYAKEKDFSKYFPLFQEIPRNIKLSESLSYKPRVTDSIPIVSSIDWGRVSSRALAGAMVGGILMFFCALFSKRGKNKTK